MSKGGDPPLLVAANRAMETIARHFHRRLKGAFELGELRSWAAKGAMDAMQKWDGSGHFEGFAMQRARWALLDGLRRQLRQDHRANLRPRVGALLAAEEAADLLPDDLRGGEEHDAPSIDDAIADGAAAYTVELSADEEALKVVDSSANVERDTDRMRARRAVEQLPEPLCRVVERHVYFGDTFADIGGMLEMSTSTVTDMFARAVRLLREQFQLEPAEVGDGPGTEVTPLFASTGPPSRRKKGK